MKKKIKKAVKIVKKVALKIKKPSNIVIHILVDDEIPVR
jgi:hypothetical protein